jgi:hypothetical protein
MTAIGKTSGAEANLREQFEQHRCERELPGKKVA